uniref:ATPase of the ABC class n=1 Tax=Magnetococcus massalia (strain MO-1) TaxID=451514 RepID=A0A1S7LCQ6_MAGMO|nr:conserved protein of unknown function [Candidatus Magnetococcus massalia]
MEKLSKLLHQIDGSGYPNYKRLKGAHPHPCGELLIDHVQGDPFAAPSPMRLLLPALGSLPTAPAPLAQRAIEDFLGRRLQQGLQSIKPGQGSGRSGELRFMLHDQRIMQRSAVKLQPDGPLEIRFQAGLPANGRRILGRAAEKLLLETLSRWITQALTLTAEDHIALQAHIHCLEDQQWLRAWLTEQRAIAFIADGATLPRASGVDDHPLPQHQATPFVAPDGVAHTLTLPHAGPQRGLLIAEGITLLVGGGFHGKSTLLSAIAHGVSDHIPGDGRERVVTRSDTQAVQAEDGRAIHALDLTPFINNLPGGRDASRLSTENASGSTSQAASMIEAWGCGTQTLLIDEDSSATNLMIRDHRMQRLVSAEQEPITPLELQIEALHHDYGLSFIMVMGGSSAFFESAHSVLQMENYQLKDRTAACQQIVQQHPLPSRPATQHALSMTQSDDRRVRRSALDPTRGRRKRLIKVREAGVLEYGQQSIDLRRTATIPSEGETRTIGHLLASSWSDLSQELITMAQLRQIYHSYEREGMEGLTPDYPQGDLAWPRFEHLMAAVWRMRQTGSITD